MGCVAALASRLLRGHDEPARVADAATRASDAAGADPVLEVNRALAVWLNEGRAPAEKILDAVAAADPETPPLRRSLAEAYLEMGLAEKALGALEGLGDPVAVSLEIDALDQLGRKQAFQARRDEAIEDEALSGHPAIVRHRLERDLAGGNYDRVIERAEEALQSAGRYAAEIAEIRARALNAIGSRGDADRSLDAVARSARKDVGLAEGWEAKLALIRLNLRRGGNFLFKAVAVTLELYKGGVRDAELSYSYAVANIRQGNERGAMRYLREAIELDPSFVPPYTQLSLLNKLGDEQRALLERTRPGATP